MMRSITFGMLLLIGSAAASAADAPAKADPAKGGAETKAVKVKYNPATAISFNQELRLPFESLTGLGARIDQARTAYDPVGLAVAAAELGVAEKVSKKTAQLTADTLQKEAIELAKMRRMSGELAAVALLIKDEAAAKDLASLSGVAATEEKNQLEAAKRGEESRGFRHLVVRNNTEVTIHGVRANGQHLGSVPPYSTRTFNTPWLEHHAQISLGAHDQFGDQWRSHFVTGNHIHYTWTLNP